MYHFCTYFDRNYLVRGLALYLSLTRHAGPFTLYVLCLDDFTHAYLTGLGLPGLRPVSLGELEAHDPELAAAKSTRSRVEYYFTCSPAWPLYLLDRHPAIDVITYLDADLYFFSSPRPVFDELDGNSVLIIPHRYPAALRGRETHGIYNVGFLSFRRDEHGLECLRWWRERCLEWCYDRLEAGRFADQKYLDEWPARFKGVVVCRNKGANLAPWNVAGHRVHLSGRTVLVDSDPLVFYHFHALRVVTPYLFGSGLGLYRAKLGSVLRRHVYGPYLRELRELMAETHAARAGGPRRSKLLEMGMLLFDGVPLLARGSATAGMNLRPLIQPAYRLARPLLHTLWAGLCPRSATKTET